LAYSGCDNDLKNVAVANLDNVNKEAYSAQINLLFSPVVNGVFGVEYVKGLRKVESGDEGAIEAITLLLRYDF